MRHRLTSAILLLYPRRVRDRHGPEIAALIDDLATHEGRSRTGLFIRLAVDGLVQRLASTATAWTVVAVAVATSFGGLAVSGFAAANATRHVAPPTAHGIAPVRSPLGRRSAHEGTTVQVGPVANVDRHGDGTPRDAASHRHRRRAREHLAR
jgi:hypothetical protein